MRQQPPKENEADYTPWPPDPPDATLHWDAEWVAPPDGPPDLGHLHWIDPDGNHAVIQVTHGADTVLRNTDGKAVTNVWNITEVDSGLFLRVTPSIHFIGYFHSPKPVTFRQVPELPWPE